MTSTVTYTGNLRTTCVHVKSNDSFITDAPTDNNGFGQAFSPTDTVVTALASCMLTMMGIKAKAMEENLVGAVAQVTKHMAASPRRIAKIEVVFHLPSNVSEQNRTILEKTANTCPVIYSLHPDIEKVVSFQWVN